MLCKLLCTQVKAEATEDCGDAHGFLQQQRRALLFLWVLSTIQPQCLGLEPPPPLECDAHLSGLQMTAECQVEPAFDPESYYYECVIPFDVSEFWILPEPIQRSAEVQVIS